METGELVRSCETCLFMATHDHCDGCLGKDTNNFQYANYQEGNWMKRASQFELDGKRNIVIGGQGEAEVNTRWTPQKTTKHLHYVAEQCGYMVGTLSTKGDTKTLKITTSEGIFRLVWVNDQLEHIETWNYDYDWDTNTDNSKCIGNFWDRQFIENTILAMADQPINRHAVPGKDEIMELDAGIKSYVETLREAGVETYESCEGGKGHPYPEPTIRFHGDHFEGFKVLAIALQYNFPVAYLRIVWSIEDLRPVGPTWEIVFSKQE